jgi:hypothetical protein
LGQATSKEFNVPQDTLSAEQLDQLPAGQELDALVAEKVMEEAKPLVGHEDVHLEPRKSCGGNWLCWPEYDRGDMCEWAPAPFSTDIRAAWEVAEKMNEELWKRGIVFEMGNNPHNPKRAWWVNLIFAEQNGRHETEIISAEIMPLAICRDALKAALSSITGTR